jgi:hypothetical protein
MEMITLHAYVGADGILTLQTPIKATNVEVEVVIVVQPAKPEAAEAAGGQGEKLVSEPPGEYDVREETAPPLAGLIGAAQGGFATPEEVDRFIEGMRGEGAPGINKKPLEELVKELTPAARQELRDFAEFLWRKQMTPAVTDLGWPPGFFERFEGSLPDFPAIESEGDYEVRDDLA